MPGIRENGGQYTHAATWVVLATALLGQGERAMELFGLLNPIHHADSPDKVARYKVEPYVVAADVYGVAAAHRPRRLDLVHRFGGLVVPRWPGSNPRFSPAKAAGCR